MSRLFVQLYLDEDVHVLVAALIAASNSQYGFIGLGMTVRTELVEVRSSFDQLRTNGKTCKTRIAGLLPGALMS